MTWVSAQHCPILAVRLFVGTERAGLTLSQLMPRSYPFFDPSLTKSIIQPRRFLMHFTGNASVLSTHGIRLPSKLKAQSTLHVGRACARPAHTQDNKKRSSLSSIHISKHIREQCNMCAPHKVINNDTPIPNHIMESYRFHLHGSLRCGAYGPLLWQIMNMTAIVRPQLTL